MFKQLPEKEFSFDIDIIGESTGQEYKGRFTAKATLSIGERVELERAISSFISDFANPTDNLSNLAIMISNIRFHITKYPDWWDINTNGIEIEDLNLIAEIFSKIMKGKADWSKKISKTAKKSINKDTEKSEEAKEVEKEGPLE